MKILIKLRFPKLNFDKVSSLKKKKWPHTSHHIYNLIFAVWILEHICPNFLKNKNKNRYYTPVEVLKPNLKLKTIPKVLNHATYVGLNCTSPSLFYFFFFGKGGGSWCLPFSSDSKNFGENHQNANTYAPTNRWGKILCTAIFMSFVASRPSPISRNYFVVRILAVWY